MAYNPADFELVEAPAGSASPYNPADFELVAMPEGSGFWRQAADLPVSAAGGVITGLKGMTDLFGANNPVSQELASYQEFYRQSLSPEAQADQQEIARIMQEAQDKGVWEQVKAGARAFSVAPLDTAAQSLGTMAPIVATGLAGRAFGLGAKGVQAVQAGAGAGMNTGIVKDSIYQDTKNFLLQSGKSEAEADRVALEAQSYGGQNIDQLLIAAGLGAADALFGAEKILGNAISKSGGRVTGGVVAGALKTGVSEAIPEAAQGGQEAIAPNIALQREGYAVPTMRGVASSATMEGLAGFAAGAPVGAAEGMAAPRLDDRNVPPISVGPQESTFTPPPAAETVAVEEVFGDATTAAAPVEEAAPAAEPAINPDDFEVVEMPSDPIVTEPPAAAEVLAEPANQTEAAEVPIAEANARQQTESNNVAQDVVNEPSATPVNFASATSREEAGSMARKMARRDPSLPPLPPPEFEALQAIANRAAKRGYDPSVITQDSIKAAKDAGYITKTKSPKLTEDGRAKLSQWADMATEREMAMADLQDRLADQAVSEWDAANDPTSAAAIAAKRPAAQPAAATPSFAEDLPQAKAVKDARGRSVVVTEANAKKMSDEKVMTSYAVFADTMMRAREAGQDIDPVVRVNAATVYQEGRRRNLVPQEPSIEAYLGTQPQDSPAQKSRRRIKNMTAQSGAIDLSIVEDLVEYGKTIYRAGMTYAQWAAAMVKEFGQAVAEFLQQAFNRVVEAYQNSRFSDTTGAVGDVRPKAKPRQFEQKAAQSPGLDAETRAQMGGDNYVPITLRGVAEQAKAWMAENGVEAAERRILELNSEDTTPTPLDFAIGLELTANLSATGQHARAAAVVRTMSRRATSLGQTISTLAMLSRLTPEGIVFYANQIIEQYIGSLPPERQQQIRAAQDGIRQLETDVATTRKRTAEDTIIKGEQGGEKIQDKLKRRIPDKGQKQQTNVSIRSVLTSQATKAEATKQIAQILVDNGISQSEATAMATAITNRFYKVLEDARKAAAANRRPASGKGRVTFDKLMAQLKDGKITDQEFIATLARLADLPALTPEIEATINKLANEVRSATDEDIKMVAATKMFEVVYGLIPPDFWAKVRTFRVLMMLFSPKTWAKNLGGNQVQWFLHIGRDSFINSFVDPAVSLITGRRTSGFARTGRVKALLTPLSDLKKGYMWNKQNNPSANFFENSRAALSHLRVLAKLTTQNKFEMADVKDVGRKVFSDPFMGTLESVLSVALGGPDRAFWMSAYRASIAQREAAAKANGEWLGFLSPEDIEGAQADAMAAIYQNKNSLSDLGIDVRRRLNKFSMRQLAKIIPGLKETDQYGLGSMLLTFAQVPGAIARAAINWSPLGTVNALYESMNGILWKASNQRFGKPFDQAAFNKAFTEALGGTGIYLAGYWLYAMGVITASQEEDKDLEAMRKAMGMGQFSINLSALKRMLLSGNIWEKQETRFGDAIYKYDWVQPIAITFAAGAELAKMVEENDRNGVRKGLAGKAGMAAISLAAGAKSLEDLPLLSGLSSFLRTWGNEGMLMAVTKTIASEPAAFVPQLVRQANQLMDNTLRQTRGGDSVVARAFNQLAANTPFVGDSFPPRLDITGTPVERYQRNGNTLFNVLVNPAIATYARTNPAFDEAQRLMNSTGETRQIPKEVQRAATINGQRINLSNEQMSAYQYYLGNYTLSMYNYRMNSPRYVRLPDTEKVRILAQDIEDVDAAVKSALFGHDIRRLTRRQRVMRNNLVNSPLGQSMPPR